MEPLGAQRRLAAILAADMVGFSRLVGIDEEGTLARQKSHRRELIDPTIAAYGGRIVKTTGDGVLAEFPSVVDALRCAVTVQMAMPEREARIPEDTRIAYRVGINAGDIVIDGDDIYGEGVNVAARLEGIAEPGGICVSRAVFDQVKGKVNSEFEDHGRKQVKNIAEPIQVYAVRMRSEAAPAGSAETPGRPGHRWGATAAVTVVSIAAAAVLYWQPWAPDFEPSSVEQKALPSPEKPSVAVLPFDNLSDDPSQEYFADGITEDLTTDLSQISGLFVVSRNSSFTYKGESVDVRRVGRELGVKYVVEGSVRRVGDQIRINAQLIDAASGGHMWAERFDGTMADVFSLQDDVNRKIVEALAVSLTADDREKMGKVETRNPLAYDTLLRGLNVYQRYDRQSNAEARDIFTRAIELDPGYARAYANVALTHASDVNFNWTDDLEQSVRLGLEYADKAIELDDSIPQIYLTRGLLYLSQRRHDAAIEASRRTVEVHPSYADGYAALAFVLSYTGQLEEALEAIHQAKHLNPQSPAVYWGVEGRILFLLGRYAEAVGVLEQSVQRNPTFDRTLLSLAAAYAQLGRLDDAAWTVEEALMINPAISLDDERRDGNYKGTRDLDHYIDALRKAGVPER